MADIEVWQINRIKEIQKEIVKEIDRICRANNIRYYLAYGTLIGAIRHNGFIPWDDDIDIMMPYEDMKKFETIVATDLDTKRFFYQSPETEEDYGLTINRIRRNGTILETKDLQGKNVHKGVFVDIYPMFCAEEGKIKRKIQIIQAMLRALYMLEEPVQNHGKLMKWGSGFLLKITTKKHREKIVRKLTKKFSKKSFDESKYITGLDSCIKTMSRSYPKEWFGEGVDHVFDDLVLKVPNEAKLVLNKCYGDYTILPPESERKFHHDFTKIEV